MKYTDITFKEFTQRFIRNFPDAFKYLETSVQIYKTEDLVSYDIVTPTPLLKADFHYIIFLFSGHFEQQVGREIKKVNANQALVVMQGEVSSLIRHSQNIAGYYIIFEDRVLQKFQEHSYFMDLFTTAPIIQLSDQDSAFVQGSSKLILQEQEMAQPDEQIVLHLFQSLLLKLLKSSALKKGLSRQVDIAVAFRKLVYIHHLEQQTIQYYADQLNISANYLNRCVQTVWNKAAKKFIQEVIILQSLGLLQDFKLSISDIAYQLNFNDPAYFGRLFKQNMGVSPQEFRSRIMHDSSE